MAEQKTNVMRILGQKKIKYTAHEYPHGEDAVDGVTVARMTGRDPACVFKTLVTRGASKGIYVFVIPVAEELDLKKAAKVSGNKSCDLIPMKELLPVTGYIRGGCSPVGMKKAFPTYIEESAQLYDYIYVSAGVRGLQFKIAPDALTGYVGAVYADLI